MMLIYRRALPDAGSYQHAPWLDCAFRDRKAAADFLSNLDRRHCIKSHTPMDGILYSREPTYVVVHRHPVDMHFSFRAHVENMKDETLTYMFPGDERDGFMRFVDKPLTDAGTDDLTVASFAHHFRQAKARMANGNVHFFHYADLTRDLSGQIERRAAMLGISVSEQLLEQITDATGFESMRKAAETSERRFMILRAFLLRVLQTNGRADWPIRTWTFIEAELRRYLRRKKSLGWRMAAPVELCRSDGRALALAREFVRE
jgi:hypothetical protein